MQSSQVLIQKPSSNAEQLIVLLHGYGANAQDLIPLGSLIAERFPNAYIVSLQAPHPCALGEGYEWYSLTDVTEEDRQDPNAPIYRERVQPALPLLAHRIAKLQSETGLSAEPTLLIGFSQGSCMALEYAHSEHAALGRVIGLSGRFASLPEAANPKLTVHLIHGKTDGVIPYKHTVIAAERLVTLGADVTADVIPFTGHEINSKTVEFILQRLQTHIPKRVWDAALAADPEQQVKH